MKYVLGLGNPGKEYAYTRHNIGFLAVEQAAVLLQRNTQTEVADKAERSGLWSMLVAAFCKKADPGAWQVRGNMLSCSPRRDLLLLKPLTYMNLSGEVFKHLTGVDIDNLLVVVDDIYLPLGRLRLRDNGSSGGHNGLKSITGVLGTERYSRLRIGVGSRHDQCGNKALAAAGLADYVLGRFAEEEAVLLERVLSTGAEAILDWYRQGLNFSQQKYNGIDLRF